MADVGVEVGQKMRLAIKAKLTELNCYVDDELPDYIMVMIANKRTKSQMKDDLNLFLANQTSFFVEWLHVVLKKLKQVHVTNPNVFKNPIKRKSNEFLISQEDYKKIKKEESKMKKEKMDGKAQLSSSDGAHDFEDHVKSLTDDLPITASRLSEAGRRKIVLVEEHTKSAADDGFGQGLDDDFDIPLLSEINASNEEELEQLERRIKNVKSRLGLQVDSDREEEEEDNDEEDDEDEKDCLTIKPDPAEMEFSEQFSKSPPSRRIITSQRTLQRSATPPPIQHSPTQLEKQLEMKRSIHARIVFDKEKDSLKAKYDSIMKRTANRQDRLERSEAEHKTISENTVTETKKRSILDRLGKRPEGKERVERTENKAVRSDVRHSSIQSKVIRPQKERRRESEKNIASAILSRVGVLSKVSIPQKKPSAAHYVDERRDAEGEEPKVTPKNVPSVVKVKPRVLPAQTKQANPNLLFKAVAEAQRSVNQTPAVGKPKAVIAKPAKTENVSVRVQQEEKSPAPALFTKKYKEQLAAAAAAKKSEELANLDAKRSIIINKNKRAKLLEDEKLKLRLLLTQKVSKTETRKIVKKVSEPDDELHLDSTFNFDEFDDTRSNASGTSDKSSRTPELTQKHLDDLEEEREIFLKKKITIDNNADKTVLIKESDDDDTVDDDEGAKVAKPNHKFIVTLDGIDKLKFAHLDKPDGNGIKYPEPEIVETAVKKSTMIKTRRSPSPIVFDAPKPVVAVAPTKTKPTHNPTPIKKTDKPLLHKQISAINSHVAVHVVKKVKEKCKYFPNCRQGERCEFQHPSMCKMFPNCKFADQCMYAHPMCKFEMSCTRKNCPYSHGASNRAGGIVASAQSVCKYFPNCSNGACPFYHPNPKTCKYGMHCKNAACVFQHPGAHQVGGKLTWRPIK